MLHTFGAITLRFLQGITLVFQRREERSLKIHIGLNTVRMTPTPATWGPIIIMRLRIPIIVAIVAPCVEKSIVMNPRVDISAIAWIATVLGNL